MNNELGLLAGIVNGGDLKRFMPCGGDPQRT